MGQLLECGACGVVMSALLTAVRLHNSVVRARRETMTEAMSRGEMGIREATVAIGRCRDTLAGIDVELGAQ
jgi:hypothetical protein